MTKETLKDVVIARGEANFGDIPSSNSLIRIFTNIIADQTYSEKEVHETMHYIKEVIKGEIVADLDKQINTFKHFLKRS